MIRPQEKVLFWTGVKAYMKDDEMLILDVRSSVGTKLDLMLANTIGIVDSDYYDNPKNEGNIGICVRNLRPTMILHGYQEVKISDDIIFEIPLIEDMRGLNAVEIKRGDRIAQGIFVKYLPSDNCNTEEERAGGHGSTGGINHG